MLKRLALLLVVLLLAVVGIVFLRASLLRPSTAAVPPATPITIDTTGAIQRFAGAIRIPTESLAGQPPNAAAMLRMRDYLQASFPRVHATLAREVLPSGAMLFTWKGRDPGLAPVVLMGHLDVVPAATETLAQWKHPPFSGDLADGFLWGRGTLDDKIHVLSLFEATETLLARGFTPARTVLFAFGDDEENGGYGAQSIVKLLQQRGVHPEFVLDEGGLIVSGLIPGLARPVAAIGTAEKGYVDVALSTTGVGGHSSEPPPHTAIGELSAGLTRLEDRQFPSSMPTVIRDQDTAIAPFLPLSKRVVLANIWLFKPLLIRLGLNSPIQAGNFRTTTAETMFNAGFKENALPTSARAIVNLRILPGETVASVLDRIRTVVADPGITIANADPGGSRNPSPISPTDSTSYRTLATTIHQIFPEAIVVPNLLNAATDSSYYTVLTPNVFRFLAVDLTPSELSVIHGINERVAPEKYLKSVQFTAQLLQNIR